MLNLPHASGVSTRHGRTATRRSSRPGRRKPPLLLETLEQRLVLTVVFDPVFAKESVTSNTPYTVLNSPAIELIFWGSGWATTAGQAQAQKWAGDVQTILRSPYLTGLTEYGSDGKAVFGSSWIDPSDPPNGYQSGGGGNDANGQSSQTDMQNEIQKVIDSASSPTPPPINSATITQAPSMSSSPIQLIPIPTAGIMCLGSIRESMGPAGSI